ncbi:RagB/SusD family nutrient uptake outer membrane protein [Chitinophagaceae bacterium LB-8]|uniref:RagB/SusD family nutrient uptake outer membrane protein n=1 Tax=Paraflavisolibacter caeni TaxID=2982496 RepID=A0A9X3B7T2_9BACT|nr:RagB/SusD family nutrient uptake outer membrane protein [Paraflavisolibacter caeni]MCU7548811.1 RagB/SusD family nutrient uptake outer membrane protein [Paraflavisolibacter caeni]
MNKSMRVTKLFYTVTALLLLSLTACKKWLDLETPSQVDQDAIFSKEQGFEDVLNGVYLQMGSQNMYGRDMSYGLLSVLGRSYDTTITSAIGKLYFQGAQYNLQDDSVRIIARNIWAESYKSIGNINNLLANMDSHKQLFTGTNYNTIKGEALGLRAFLHFELLRLFAPSPAAAGFTVAAIPYMTKISPYKVVSATTGAVLDSCIADLKVSESLLSESNLKTYRFTIWATRGLLARIYLYKGDKEHALSYARALINSRKFPLADGNSDLMFSKEHLFSLYTSQNNITNLYPTVFNPDLSLGFSPGNQTSLFVAGSGLSSDWRKSFVDPKTGTAIGNTIAPRKFYNNSTSPNNANTATPLIRVTEMYYIAAECAADNNDIVYATDLLDSVRWHRNVKKDLTANLSTDSLNTEIRKEYQKEFLGEGQMFFFYKRKNQPFASLPYTRVPLVAGATYVFEKPE